MAATDRPQEQAEYLDEKKSYEDMTESPRKCVKVVLCRWQNVSPDVLTARGNWQWLLQKITLKSDTQCSQSRKCTFSRMHPNKVFVRGTWVLDVPRWSPCSSELSSLSPAAPWLWSHHLASDPATAADRSHTVADWNEVWCQAVAELHWPLQTGSHWSWPVGKAVYNQSQPAYWAFRFLKQPKKKNFLFDDYR